MVIKKQIIGLLILVALMPYLSSCVGKKPLESEMNGKWAANDGASFILREDSSFIAENFPPELFKSSGFNKKISGSGKWHIILDQGQWDLELDFDKNKGSIGELGYGLPLIIDSENGSWYIFAWEGEEGGDRYEFH